MQDKVKCSNEMQEKSIQILLTEMDTKTLHDTPQKSRAKFQCNPRLAELIELANILPPSFNFDWNKERQKHGVEKALENWEQAQQKLSLDELVNLQTVLFDERENIFIGKRSNKKVTIKGLRRFNPFALAKAEKILEIRKLLKNLYVLSKISQEEQIRDVTLLSNQETLDVLNNVHFDIDKLYGFSACRKYSEYLEKNFINVSERYRKGIVVYLTARAIALGEQAEFNCDDDEAKKFFEIWKKSFLLLEPNEEYGNKLIALLDVLAEFTLFIEKQDFRTTISIDSSGNVNFQLSKYAEALQGVNISRLRMCEYCKKLFWANRKDAYTCSLKHAKNRRMRLLRDNWKEKGDLYLKARRKKANKKKENK